MKEKKEKEITTSQVIKNCIFSIKEVFLFDKKFLIINVFVMIFLNIVYALESTYYMKWLVESIENESPFGVIAMFVVGFVMIQMLAGALDWFFFNYYQDIVTHRFIQHINKKVFTKAGNVELSCYEDPVFYNKYTRALDRTPERIMNVRKQAVSCGASLVRIAFLLSVMFSIDKGIAIFLVFPLIGNFVFGKWLNNLDQRLYKEITKPSRLIAYVQRVLHLNQYAKEMRITDVYPMIQGKHKGAVDEICDITDKYALRKGTAHWTKCIFTFTLIFEGMVIYCAYKALVKGTMTLAGITVMTSMMSSAAWAIIEFFDGLMDIHNDGIYVQNAREFLAYEEKIPEDSDGDDMPEEIKSIEFRDVWFSYKNDGNYNIKHLNLKITSPQSVAFVGQNGAGKTTLIKLLFRLYDPNKGEILLNGKDIRRYNLKQYRKRFAAAFQDYQVVAMSVLDNITMGLEIENARELAVDELKAVGLYDKIESLADGIDTMMTKEFDLDGVVLSGGQYQKLAVARAFAHSDSYPDAHSVMVFDEPSSALDPIAEYELFETILRKSENKMMIFISHRLSSVKNADNIFMFENGELVEEGSHEELMNMDGKYAFMFKRQAENYLAIESEHNEDTNEFKIEKGVESIG